MKRKFKVVMSGRLHRFDAKAVADEAVEYPGCYEFVVLDRERKPLVAFVGAAAESIRTSLEAHLSGAARPNKEDLAALSLGGEVFYEFVSSSDIDCKEEHLDIAGALISRHRPPFNAGPLPSTGKFSEVDLEEV
ncbi:MAG: hypothetical protein HY748_13495 [Elusimicrobia bacterium]|nr:hypothetical protein [Elusimicrobiota bacterium]